MKTLKLLLATVTVGLLLMAARCEKEDPNILPPESQEGKNTFECLIDGSIFATSSREFTIHSIFPLSANYYRSSKNLIIIAAKNEGIITTTTNDPQVNKSIVIGNAVYAPRDKNNWKVLPYYFEGNNVGEIVLTRFDTVNLIVSGKFHFTGQCFNRDSNLVKISNIHITKGQFDISLRIGDNAPPPLILKHLE